MTAFRWRFLLPAVLVAVCLFALCVVTAVSLFHQQATVTGVLRENVSSRRAAADLRGVLNVIVELEINEVETVAEHHARAQTHLDDIRRLANHSREVELSRQLDAGFAEYLRMWQTLPPIDHPRHKEQVRAATQFLLENVLIPCREIERFNDGWVEATTAQHERVLSQLAWGMAVVGGLGMVAGVVFGFGLARALSRSLRQLQVQIRTAAGKLDPAAPEIVLTGEAGFGVLHGDVDRLSERIERVVQDLHDRELEVARAEQLAAVGQLAAGVGHEIRNPLTAIKLFVQAAIDDPAGGLSTADLKLIDEEVRRIEQSLKTFLDFA
ncbi:MAG TPA: histidine kinase dimerization/phospho-acceptor domain-containing protein, partial [Gemmataceae bacterium]|nr:histidine kinase dimerization/phospho-acceptor domain-containing protein [Gemmataceae bacterium]